MNSGGGAFWASSPFQEKGESMGPTQTSTHLRNKDNGRIMPWSAVKAGLANMEPYNYSEPGAEDAPAEAETASGAEGPVNADKN